MGAGRAWGARSARDARRRRDRRPRCAARHRVCVGARALGIGRGGGRAPRAGRVGGRARPVRSVRVSRSTPVGRLAGEARPACRPRPRRSRVAAQRAHRRRRRGIPLGASSGLGVADARRSRAPGPHAGGARRGRLRRRSQRARGRVLLPRRALQPRPAAMVLRRRRDTRDDQLRRAVPGRSAAAEEHRARRRRRLLSGAARRDQLLAPVVVGEPGAGAPERAGLLRGLPYPRLRMSLMAATLAAVTALIALDDAGPASLFRHAYLVPVVVAALRFGALAGRLGFDDLVLVARDGARLVVEGGDRVVPGSLVARVLDSGVPELVWDAGRDVRSRRAFAAPLVAGGQAIGVLAVERKGEIPAEERAALEALGAHVGLALENARLASRQRHFAAELAEKVRAARQELEELDRAKSTFVAIASHELRTPLTALQGFSELLALRRLPPEEVSRLAGIMRREAKRLGRIVSDLLDLSRIERGLDPALCRIPLAVEPAIVATVDLFRQGTVTHPIAITCEPSLPRVDADPDALERILTNLLSNAIKYSPLGSVVRVGGRALGGAVAIEVADAGRGIPAEALGRIFEPYYRAPDAAGTTHGTGIGLAVVKALVEAHGGAVRVESAPVIGTRVTVILPAFHGPVP